MKELEKPGLFYLADRDVLVVKLTQGTTSTEAMKTHLMPTDEDGLPEVFFFVGQDSGRLSGVAISNAARSVPNEVWKQAQAPSADGTAPLRAPYPVRASDDPRAVVFQFFEGAQAVTRGHCGTDLPNGHEVRLMLANSRRIVGLIVFDADDALPPEVLPAQNGPVTG